MLARLAALLLVLFAIPAAAQTSPASVAGSWALQFEGTSIFRFDIEQNGDKWKGTWWRPRTFAPGEKGDTFFGVSGPPVEVPSADDGHAIAEWIELTFPDNRPGAIPDVFRFRLIGQDRAEALYVGTGLPPFVLVRVPAGSVAGPWDKDHTYRRATVASLGLPAEVEPKPPEPQATRAPALPPLSLPPRQSDRPPGEGGR